MPFDDNNEVISVSGEVVAVTDKGVLIMIADIEDDDAYAGEEEWFPLSQITGGGVFERGDTVTIEVNAWVLKKRGMV